MKKKSQLEDDKELEILKAVAQAWYNHSGSSGTTSEFDARRRNFKGRLPSRFKLEAMRKSSSNDGHQSGNAKWDFGQSLWDAYELAAVSKRLETGLVIDDNPITQMDGPASRVLRRRRESKHSLRSLLDKVSSRRFTEADIPPDKDA